MAYNACSHTSISWLYSVGVKRMLKTIFDVGVVEMIHTMEEVGPTDATDRAYDQSSWTVYDDKGSIVSKGK